MKTTETFSCMGTTFSVEASNGLELRQWIREREGKYSRFIIDSELSRLNHLPASKEWIPISKEFYDILWLTVSYMTTTDGLFNPFLGQQLISLGYGESFYECNNGASEQIRVTQPIDESPFLFHSKQSMIKKLHDVYVDLGGFVKGWSVDKAYGMAIGDERFIDGGGDLRFSLKKPIVIGVINPFHFESDLIQLKMSTGAMATSSVMHRRWETKNGEVHHHLLHGHTGMNPRSDVVQVTVLASTVREAEVYAKVLCMMDAEAAESWMKKKRLSIAAIIITKDRKVRITKNIYKYCEGVETAWS